MGIDISRSSHVMNPKNIKSNIHIIGVGAVGSTVVEGLITQGIAGSQIYVYDYDHVEDHNLANQIYTLEDVGKPKVEALYTKILRDYGEKINVNNVKFTSNSSISGVVFLLVDDGRDVIYKGLKNKPSIEIIIETRLDARAGQCMIFSPLSLAHQRYFEESIKDLNDTTDGDAEVSVCGTRQVVKQTVSILAGMAVWELIKWVNDPTYMGKFTYFAAQPWYVHTEEF